MDLRDESRLTGTCEYIVSVRQTAEIRDVLAGSDHAVTTVGACTGIVGAAVPNGGIVLDMTGLSGILGFGDNGTEKWVDVLPGTRLEEIRAWVSAHAPGFFFAPDPTEETATIGGMFATNAGGPRSMQYYGRTGSHILSADIRLATGELLSLDRGVSVFGENGRCVLSDGRALDIKVLPSEADHTLLPYPGMDLLDLFAGSEGMLGITERLRLRLIPCERVRWGVFFFLPGSAAPIFADRASELFAQDSACALTAMEYLDEEALGIIIALREHQSRLAALPEPPVGVCAVYCELASEQEAAAESLLLELLELFLEEGGDETLTWSADTQDQLTRFRWFRHAVAEGVNSIVDQNRLKDACITKVAADVSFPSLAAADLLPELHTVLAKSGIPYTIFGHIGRRSLHINLLPDSEAELLRCEAIQDRLIEWSAATGGVFAAENGFGKLKRRAALKYFSSEHRDAMRMIKDFFDPLHRLNPGNMI